MPGNRSTASRTVVSGLMITSPSVGCGPPNVLFRPSSPGDNPPPKLPLQGCRVLGEFSQAVLPLVQDQRIHRLGRLTPALLREFLLQVAERQVHFLAEEGFEVLRRDAIILLVRAQVRVQRMRRQRRHVEDVRLRPVLGVQRYRDLPLVHHAVDDRAFLHESHPGGAPRALTHAGRRNPLLDAREAADALLADAPRFIEVYLLVRACRRALVGALAQIFVAQNKSEFLVLEQRVVGTGLQTRGVRAVVAHPRQVEEVRVRPGAATLVLIPVRSPGLAAGDLLEVHRTSLAALQHLVIVVVPAAAEFLVSGDLPLLELPVLIAAAPRLQLLGSTLAGLRIDCHPPLVVRALFALVPEDLASHRARLTANAFVEVEDPGQLLLYLGAVSCHLLLLCRAS